MARGWESKSVESQIEDRESPVIAGNVHADADKERELQLLTMTSKRLEREIAFASSKRFREMKQRALLHIQSRINDLGAAPNA